MPTIDELRRGVAQLRAAGNGALDSKGRLCAEVDDAVDLLPLIENGLRPIGFTDGRYQFEIRVDGAPLVISTRHPDGATLAKTLAARRGNRKARRSRVVARQKTPTLKEE